MLSCGCMLEVCPRYAQSQQKNVNGNTTKVTMVYHMVFLPRELC